MSGGGGKGGSSSSSTQIDPAITAAARDMLDTANAVSAIPYSPNRGVQVAAFTPQQEAAFKAADSAASAFGLPSAGGSATSAIPAAEKSASGIAGYSFNKDYDATQKASVSPGLQDAINKLYADRATGEYNGKSDSPLYEPKYANMPQAKASGGGGK